ncbi:cell division protein FtsK [Streptococcus equi subsp. zooepidemicus]|uniref:FtsK/SpoIIIE domain-containing protein n=1 Tax=Streptococcus equi TaxID=1336 RepID=UPI001E3E0A2F|nr:FtsK/SpoIIIE domain-containing protein [Streptococcus equi]MCD3380021.1 cell division protein FtsK [Streptococcus equi subsp. zooepidemicus]MCD3409314.1 cell division protein FtsK [Streptococcus equi subsp. zooepidemicus]HEL0663248.1 cell division protein FtsK [Streptococcus equi subsp. zooepidemicus]
MRLLPEYRGIKVRPYMRHLSYYLFSFLLGLFLMPIGVYSYYHFDLLKMMDKLALISVGVSFLSSLLLSLYLTWFLQEATPLFKKLDRLKRLAIFLFENGFVYEKRQASNKKYKIKFPRVYLKQGKFDLNVSFEMAGNKFQKRFKDIGGELEDTFFMDFMEKTDDPRFKTYKLAYSAFLSRITVNDVVWEKDKGIKLMNGYYWDFINDPHLLVAGGTGGGKTVLLRSILKCLATIGVADICDPKRADFLTLIDLPVFRNRIVFEKADIIAKFESALTIMYARYDFIRSEMQRLGHKDMGKFYDYGLEPYFFVCDEYNALMSSLSYQEREIVENAFTQFVLLGRQVGCNAIIAMQKPSADDLPTKIRSNMMHHIAVGRLDDGGYMMLFGEENRHKEFKYIKYLSGRRVYGRGYSAVFGEVAREFYAPLLTKKFSFYDEFAKLSRHENPFDPAENTLVSQDIVSDAVLRKFVEDVSVGELSNIDDVVNDVREEVVETMGLGDLAKASGFTFGKIKNVIDMIEKDNYMTFARLEDKVVLSEADAVVLVNLLTQKESFEGSWKELLSQYFTGA